MGGAGAGGRERGGAHRHLKEAGGEVLSVASLYRVVRRDLRSGRVLPERVVVRREREGQQTRLALADVVAGMREDGAAKEAARRPANRASAAASAVLPSGEGGAASGVALPADPTRLGGFAGPWCRAWRQRCRSAAVGAGRRCPRCSPSPVGGPGPLLFLHASVVRPWFGLSVRRTMEVWAPVTRTRAPSSNRRGRR